MDARIRRLGSLLEAMAAVAFSFPLSLVLTWPPSGEDLSALQSLMYLGSCEAGKSYYPTVWREKGLNDLLKVTGED